VKQNTFEVNVSALRTRWAAWNGEAINKCQLYAMFAELELREVALLAVADINIVSIAARRYIDERPELHRTRTVVRLLRRADKAAGRKTPPRDTRRRAQLFTKPPIGDSRLLAAQKEFAAKLRLQSRKYARRLIFPAWQFLPEHPGILDQLIEAKRQHLAVQRLIKEKQQ